MPTLFWDTETTDKWDFNASSTAEHQPVLLQLAAILDDDERNSVAEVKLLISNTGFTIAPGAAAVHGITQDKADAHGVSLANANFVFRDLCANADFVVAHNIDFDKRIMDRALRLSETPPIPWEKLTLRCTMKSATSICKVPNKNRGGYKWPSLNEALRFFHGRDVEGAHDAMNDVRACRDIYYSLLDQKAFG